MLEMSEIWHSNDNIKSLVKQTESVDVEESRLLWHLSINYHTTISRFIYRRAFWIIRFLRQYKHNMQCRPGNDKKIQSVQNNGNSDCVLKENNYGPFTYSVCVSGNANANVRMGTPPIHFAALALPLMLMLSVNRFI